MKKYLFISIFIFVSFGSASFYQSKKNNALNFTGKSFSYFENGNIQSERNYLNGKLHGKYVFFNQNGTVKKVYNYNMGVFEN